MKVSSSHDEFNRDEKAALRQVADLCAQTLNHKLEAPISGVRFTTQQIDSTGLGLISVAGELVDPACIRLALCLTQSDCQPRVKVDLLFGRLSKLGSRVYLLPPEDNGNDLISYQVGLEVKASLLGAGRATGFVAELEKLNHLAVELAKDFPEAVSAQSLNVAYKEFAEILAPVEARLDLDLEPWANDVASYLVSGLPVALVVLEQLEAEYLLAQIARALLRWNRSLGQYLLPTIDAAGLVKLADQAPGPICMPGIALSISSNPYSIGAEIQTLLHALRATRQPVLFTGDEATLQSVFAGGQGHVPDPLGPVVVDPPPLDNQKLMLNCIEQCAAHMGGLSVNEKAQVVTNVEQALAEVASTDQTRLLKPTVLKELSALSAGLSIDIDFVKKIGARKRNLSGLSSQTKIDRRADVQANFARVLADEGLSQQLQADLIGQSIALDQLSERLRTEALSRDLHQPIAFCSQGVPGVGKSESCILIAELLGIPYFNIDAASMPDYQTAASQLLGSGRGIVMSNKAGRLEQIAKIPTGAVVEISDLDHATPSVRSTLADLFLQVLESGQAQSSVGSMFACANLIFGFTLNLPDGADEGVRRPFGFGAAPDVSEIAERVDSEIKHMLSSAFLSRVGSPILFDSLADEALGELVEKCLIESVMTAMQRLGVPCKNVRVAGSLGETLLKDFRRRFVGTGARQIKEFCRRQASQAAVEFTRTQPINLAQDLLLDVLNGHVFLEQ